MNGASVRGFLTEPEHRMVLVLTPDDDSARRKCHEAMFDGSDVITVEHPVSLPAGPLPREIAAIAAHITGATWLVPLEVTFAPTTTYELGAERMSGDALRAAAVQPRRSFPDAIRAVVRATARPHPAHRERQTFVPAAGVPRSVLIPLHVPIFTRSVHVRIDGLGPSRLTLDEARLLRRGASPHQLDLTAAWPPISVAGGAAATFGALSVHVPTGSVEFALEIPTLWNVLGDHQPWDAIELRFVHEPRSREAALTSEALALFSEPLRR